MINSEPFITSWKQAVKSPSTIKGKIRNIARNGYINMASKVSNHSNDCNNLRLLYCHYVFDDQKEKFEEIILYLKSIGEFISTNDCVDILNGKTSLSKNYFHLSFNDGFRNVFTNALPILQKHNVPAIFFTPTSIVSSDFKIIKDYCLNTTNNRGIIEMLKWEDLKQIVSLGFDVGSHTKTHARLSDISNSPNLLMDEILGSKQKIEETLGIECKYISWPYGALDDFDSSSLKMVKKSGYSACFSAIRGKVIPNITDRYRIPRHHFEVFWPLSHVKFFGQGGWEKDV
ncbi:MAG: polysaccharide deacetylase family protein [Nitrospinales bacterium]